MFTGIIEAVGAVKSIEKRGASGRIKIEAGLDLSGTAIGESIAVSGACLTVVAVAGGSFTADMSAETLRATTLGALAAGSLVNVERALTLSKPLGGHLVTGHVDGVGAIRGVNPNGGYLDVEIGCPPELMAQLVKKGSVAVDGISLTVAGLKEDHFVAAVIPHTLANTTLRAAGLGAAVNIETDIIGKYVERFLSKGKPGGVTESFLAEHGFLRKG
ncbi:MAG: riboflavin synthase [Deltaproteobacteria bacterium]|nr:riboflavin synthase [Deltaproteobacteria bacterium]